MTMASCTIVTKKKQHNCRLKYGFTLAEAMITLVVLSMAAAGVLLPFSSGAKVQAEGIRSTLGAKLASDLIEEVLNTSFDQIISTYNYTEQKGQLYDAEGNIFTDSAYSNFSRTVTSEYVDVPVSSGNYTSGIEYILVTVQVNYDNREIASISRLITQ